MVKALTTVVFILLLGCGGASGDPAGDERGGLTQGPGAIAGAAKFGAACQSNEDCGGGSCWHFERYDSQCWGTACTVTCTADADCAAIVRSSGRGGIAPFLCGTDRLCRMEFVNTEDRSFSCQ